MPTYSFYDTKTGEEFEAFLKISEREEYLRSNPHIQSVITAAAIVGAVSTSKQNKVPDVCLLYTSPSPRDKRQSRMPSSA